MHEHLDDHLSETKVPEVQRSMLHLNSLNSLSSPAPIALIAPIRPIGPWVPWVPWIRRLSPSEPSVLDFTMGTATGSATLARNGVEAHTSLGSAATIKTD